MKLSCKQRRIRIKTDRPGVRLHNRNAKEAERQRRDTRMMEKIKAGALPFTPPVMSWLSKKLDKRSSGITPQDIKTLVG